MTDLKKIIEKAKMFSDKETGDAIRPLFVIANNVGQILAEKLNADRNIVMIGTLFMDLKHRQAKEENRLHDHVKMSYDAAKEFLNKYNIDRKTTYKILNCVEAHHRKVLFTCTEAEICANADCYKFLHPKGFFQYIGILSKRDGNFEDILKLAEEKLDEKWKILSLDICKKELEEYYHMFKKIIKESRKSKI